MSSTITLVGCVIGAPLSCSVIQREARETGGDHHGPRQLRYAVAVFQNASSDVSVLLFDATSVSTPVLVSKPVSLPEHSSVSVL